MPPNVYLLKNISNAILLRPGIIIWLDGALVSSSASEGHPFHVQKLANSNSLHSPMYMSQLKGQRETGRPGQYGDTLEEVNQELHSSWISFATEVPFKEGQENPGTARANSKQSSTAPPKTALPSW